MSRDHARVQSREDGLLGPRTLQVQVQRRRVGLLGSRRVGLLGSRRRVNPVPHQHQRYLLRRHPVPHHYQRDLLRIYRNPDPAPLAPGPVVDSQIPGPSGAGAPPFNWREKRFFLTSQRPPTSEADEEPGIGASLEDATEEDATEEDATEEGAEIAASLEDAAEDNADVAGGRRRGGRAPNGGFAAAETGQSTRTEQRQA
ncbi:unnamed protein product [Boreogadus saida]